MRFRHPGTVPDLDGETYFDTLEHLHKTLQPKTYLEIGTLTGRSLQISTCDSIAIDPDFCLEAEYLSKIMAKPSLHFFRMTSDDFFNSYSPLDIFGQPIEFAFLDGMHLCEFLLRDFMNTEKHCSHSATIVLHDCLPVEEGMAERDGPQSSRSAPHRQGWWTGDVWRTALLLKRRRPDLRIRAFDAYATGLILIDQLDPSNKYLFDNYDVLAAEMLTWSYTEIGIEGLINELEVRSTATLY